MPIAAQLDALLYRRAGAQAPQRLIRVGRHHIHLRDTGGDGPVLLMAPDGPCVLSHYEALIERLAPNLRVICLDLPGFGHSAPQSDYAHRLEQGTDILLGVLDALRVPRAALALSCVNGYYAIAAAARAPERISHLILAQTPGLGAMRMWVQRMVPAPIRVPVVGQMLNYLTRHKVAEGWYKVALARREDRPAFITQAHHALDTGGCYCFAGVVQGMSDTSPQHPLLAPLEIPALLLWGSADRSHRQTEPESLRQHLPRLQIETLDCGHFPELEQPEIYARHVLEFLR